MHYTGLEHETTVIGICVADAPNCRLLESASVHLGVVPKILRMHDGMPSLAEILDVEMILSDVEPGCRAVEHLRRAETSKEGYRPAVIAVFPADAEENTEDLERLFDGILHLPQAPAAIAAQLSVALYAHRMSAHGVKDPSEELKLNRQIFHSVTSGITVASAEGDLPLTYVNPAFEVMTGFALEDVVGKNCRFLQGEEHDQPGLTLVREAIRDESEVVATLKNYRKDGSPFWNELSMFPIRGRDGEVTHFVGVQADVTSRVEFENALRESEKLAVVGRMAASIAHEINNPLESVTNLVYLAERSDTFDESREYLSLVDQELRRVKLITSQSLRFYKQQSSPQAVQLAELLDSVMCLQKGRTTAAQVRVKRRDCLHRSIVCMENEIRQVLNNLINNATDAMKIRGGGRLLIRTAETTWWATGEKGVVITIADDGGGISPASIKNIYQAFFTTKGSHGTGLGLWISAEIVQRHHGHLQVRSRQGQEGSGTVFRLFLPFQGVAGKNLAGFENSAGFTD